MYVVTGATGNTGKVVAEKLLAAGKEVRVIGRSEDRLQELVNKGATPVVGDLNDSRFLQEAFKGAEGVYAMIPPKYDAPDFRDYQREIAENLANAVKANEIPHVVTLSSFGAHLEEGAGVVSGLHPFEKVFNRLEDTHVTHLRAGYFFENFFASIPVIKDQGILGGFPIAGDTKLNMVATSDIGAVAAETLLKKDFEGNNVRFLSNQKTYSLNEAAPILGKAIDQPELSYVAFPAEGARQAMVGMGMSESLADQYIEFSEASSKGLLSGDTGNHPEIHTATSLEDFANYFAVAYKS